ncbi:MAG: radical SAM protein [Xanthobacteraceae bacterium]
MRTIKGEVVSTAAGMVMRKNCPEHGAFECVVSSDLETYQRMRRSPRIVRLPAQTATQEAKGCPDDCGLCPAHDQHTCLAIVEITSRCNLPCPVCLADATAKGSDISIAQLASALNSLRRAEGAATPLQLAGGEPTLHPELVAIIRQARAMGFGKMEVDSNGLLLARDPALAARLREAGLSGVYLQMDGLDANEQIFLRGRNLLPEKLKAIENCRRTGLQVVLSVTLVPEVNDRSIWDMIQFAVQQRLTGINFQSVALAGRYPASLSKSKRFTAGHFMRQVEAQSGGKLLATDLSLMSCPDPRCGLLAHTIINPSGDLLPLSRVVGEQGLRKHVADLSDWDTLLKQLGCDTEHCNCGNEPDPRGKLANLMQGSECFSIGFHGMMDAYCLDVERARRCCIHKLTMDGKLMPFCLYNAKYRLQGH